MKLTSEDFAEKMMKMHNFYWPDSELEARQRMAIQITSIIEALEMYGIEDRGYWIKVRKIIYDKYNT